MGKKYGEPGGTTPVYPPRDWTCPKEAGGCGKYHSKPHFAYPGQIDLAKRPGEPGRVNFNREKGDEQMDESLPIKKSLVGRQGPRFDKDGFPNLLFCPHCGWIDDRGIVLIKEPMAVVA